VKLYSYVVARDFGFAPNPFYNVCTLATCKPKIRGCASIGDWVIGTGSKQRHRDGYLVYAMRISDTMTFDEYWFASEYRMKRPTFSGSKKLAYGDNIYFLNPDNSWHQENSHHSNDDGSPNMNNINRDTVYPRVLISDKFVYWGGQGPRIPILFRDYSGWDICAVRGHKVNFPESMVKSFIAWLGSLNKKGYLGDPLDW
jgi:Nucleotide modification associated domain 2